MSRKVGFFKYSASGNDFIIIQNSDLQQLTQTQIIKFCDREQGIGSDGIIGFQCDTSSKFKMFFVNPDGTHAAMCGNGARSLATHLLVNSMLAPSFSFEVGDRIFWGEVTEGVVKINLGTPKILESIGSNELWVDSGVPHLVKRVESIGENFLALAREIRHQSRFKQGTNVDFICYKKGSHHVTARVFERGVEGETLSSGTGAAACAAAWVNFEHLNAPISCYINMPGGELRIDIDSKYNYWISGEVKKVTEGYWNV